jgi:autotransporter adhesin
MGTNSSAAAVNATAIGAGANATGVVSAAIGTSAKASESNATALGPGATASAAGASALGGSSKATIADSVALGDNSATSVAVKVANAKVGNITYTFSTAGDAEAPTKVVSVGSSTIKRQIQNVANGQVTSASTDAINGSQLYAVAGQVSTNLSKINTNTTNIGINKTSITNLTTTVNKGWEADVNGTKVKAVTPTSNKLNFVAGKNVTIIGSGDNITVKTVDSPSFTNVTATGNVTVGGKVTAASETIGGKVNIGSTGITMGNTKITGLAAGTLSSTSTDAVNGSQPFATNTNVTNNATAITKVTNAVNAGWEADVNGTKVKAVTPTSNKLNFVAGKNITITGSGDDITVKTVDSPSFTNVTATGNVTAATETIGGKVNIGSTGITMGNTKITGLTPGAVNSTSTDAINGSQLYETNQTIGKGLTFVGNTGSVNKKLGDRMNIVGTGGDGLYLSDNVKTEVDSEGNLLIKTKNTYTTGVTVDPTSKKATFTRNDGQSYSLDFGDIGLSTTDYRLVGAKNTATGKYTNSYAVGDDNSVSLNVMDPNTGDLDQVTITDIAKASDIQDVKDNAVLYDNTGKDSVTLKGTNGTKITNLKDGDISSTSSDAVNGSQLYETNQNVTNLGDTVTNLGDTVNAGWKATADGTAVKTVTPTDNTLNFKSGSNVKVTNDNGNVLISADLSAIDPDSTNAVLYDGTTKDSVTLGGKTGTTITNLKDGDVSAKSSDAINGSQLYETNQNVTNLGDTVTKLGDTVDAGWELQTNGTKLKDVTPTSKIVNIQGDKKHITVTGSGNDVTISTDLSNIKADETNAVLYDGDTKDSVTLGGKTGTTITNLKDGDVSAKSSDAINGSQLYETNQNVTNLGDTVTNLGDTGQCRLESNGRRYCRQDGNPDGQHLELQVRLQCQSDQR